MECVAALSVECVAAYASPKPVQHNCTSEARQPECLRLLTTQPGSNKDATSPKPVQHNCTSETRQPECLRLLTTQPGSNKDYYMSYCMHGVGRV